MSAQYPHALTYPQRPSMRVYPHTLTHLYIGARGEGEVVEANIPQDTSLSRALELVRVKSPLFVKNQIAIRGGAGGGGGRKCGR